jgi:hypothetical protein
MTSFNSAFIRAADLLLGQNEECRQATLLLGETFESPSSEGGPVMTELGTLKAEAVSRFRFSVSLFVLNAACLRGTYRNLEDVSNNYDSGFLEPEESVSKENWSAS